MIFSTILAIRMRAKNRREKSNLIAIKNIKKGEEITWITRQQWTKMIGKWIADVRAKIAVKESRISSTCQKKSDKNT
jgi:hypothetical protein